MSKRSPVAVLTLCAVAAVASISVAYGGKGKCLRAEVPAPVVLPGGQVHPAGQLTLCVADYSPVAAYHRVAVNGMPVGLMFSQRRVAEGQQGTEPVVLFRRLGSGNLQLLGYVWPTSKQAFAYLLQGEPWDAGAQSRIPAQETAAPPLDHIGAPPGS